MRGGRPVRRARAARLSGLLIVLAAAGAPGSAPSAWAQDDPRVRSGDRREVVACDSLVTLRRLSAASGENRETAAARIGTEPGCRLVARDAVGAVEHRAMFGGAPYECMTIAGAPACLWVMP